MNFESTDFDLLDIFLLIGLKAKTGELVLESGNNIGSIIFHRGRILQAFSPYSRAIGDLLVEDGVISENELLSALEVRRKHSIFPTGYFFLRAGRVSFETIETMIHEQIRQSVKDFQKWPNIRASFVEKEIQPFDGIHLNVQEFIIPDSLSSAKDFFPALSEDKKAQASADSSNA